MDAAAEDELIQDFFAEYDDASLTIREILLELDQQPDDQDAPHALFRSMHSVKSNLRMMGLNDLSEFIHQLEDILDQIRNKQRDYISLLTDLFLLSLETVRDLCYAQLCEHPGALDKLPGYLTAMKDVHVYGNDKALIVNVIRLFDPGYEVNDTDTNQEQNIEVLHDLAMFKHMSIAMEQRLVGKQGCTERILDMALALNALSDYKIDTDQLKAAVYMHDIGMSFLPLELLNKEGSYTQDERQSITFHPKVASQLLLGLEGWDEAATMIAQHHERVDGKGYPEQLHGDEIVPGAKLLNILDTFDSMSQIRADREHRRTVIRIVAEINGHKDSQFDDYWVGIFNQYIRQRFSK